MYGYQIIKELERRSQGYFKFKEGTLYPALHRLERAGLIVGKWQTNYSAAKGGFIAFTKGVAREVGSRNITANAIAPGFITTEMTEKLPQETKDAILSRIPLKRFGVPDDVADLVAFLSSERAGYITAQVICIDGGVI